MRGEPITSCPKPERGSIVLAKEDATAKTAAQEKAAKRVAKNRDRYRCRWPEKHVCRKGLESAHIVDASLGGLCVPSNLITVCAWLHRRGPVSIHGKQLQVVPITKRGADGPCAFYRKQYSETQRGEFTWSFVARESSIGVPEKF